MKISRTLGYWIIGAAGSALVGVASAQAAPVGNAAGMRTATPAASVVEKAAYRNCRWRNGARHCHRRGDGPRVYGYSYGRPRPEAFPTGSAAWWRAMDYEGRGGHGRTR